MFLHFPRIPIQRVLYSVHIITTSESLNRVILNDKPTKEATPDHHLLAQSANELKNDIQSHSFK